MKEKIRKLSMGYVDTEIPSVLVEPASIEKSITSGEIFKSEIHITSENRLQIRGFIYSSNPKVVLSADNILGVFIHISYMIDAEKISEGEIIDGEFSIVTNAGEFVIPYSFVVKKGVANELNIDTADGFYNLYLNNTSLAIEKFLSPDFVYLPFMLEPKNRIIYDGLLEAVDVGNSIREFIYSLGFDVKEDDNITIGVSNNNITDDEKLLLRDETNFDHAKIDFECNEIMSGAALLEMNKSFKAMKLHGASMESLKFHKAEISYYKRYNKSKSYYVDRLAAYNGLKRCFEMGCRSPYLYLEVCKAYIEHPNLIREYDEITLQSINFGSIHGYLSDEIAMKIGIHAQSSKHIPLILLNSMKRMYRFYPSKELLSGIIAALIRNASTDESSFKWYLKAIEEDIQISRLYDYFIDSVPIDYDKLLPREVYLYYSYNSPSSDKGMKTLYSSVVKFFDKTSSTYSSMEMQIRRYVTKNLFLGQIDRQLAILYNEFLHIEMIDEKLATILPDILLTHEVYVPKGHDNRLVVLYEELEGEQVVQLKEGHAKLSLYTNNFHFLVEDSIGNRYYKNDIKVERLINGKDNLLYTCSRHAGSFPAFKIFEAGKLINLDSLNQSELLRLEELANSSGIHCLYKKKIHTAMLMNFDWKNNKSLSDVLVLALQDKFISGSVKALLSDTLIELDRIDDANKIISKIGFGKIDKSKLLEHCSDYIINEKDDSNELILGQSYYLFKSGLYSKETLSFLCRYYNGLSIDMANILFLSISEGACTYDIAERLLAQMLFTNQYKGIDDIFKAYITYGKAEKVVVNAYFSLKCYRYFINGEDIDVDIFESIKNVLLNQLVGGSAPIITQLAVSKYFSQMDEISDSDKKICIQIVENLVEKGAVFPYLKKLSSFISLPEEIKDKTIITYHAKEGDSVALILSSEDDDEEPIYLEMNYICSGLFVKPILLFEGEYQPYQIRITRDGISTTIDHGDMKSDIDYGDSSRKFIRLNKLLKDSDNPSDESWQEDMAEYSFDKALNNILFVN